ncbi:hypothetical protein [Aestuariibacter salexigens]|uniref:hypothetical protein n=1 Tax=Aestuariibacter salexigens TaxID=226010 RepID=UPI0003F52788|nr:hypothetical protein [Aestuariibacter salexigens]
MAKKQQDRVDAADEQQRRDFIKRFGKLAAITPVAMTTLMSPSTSAAPKSCRGNGAKGCN